jgi:histone H3/H4
MADYIVRSKVADLIKGKGMMMASDSVAALDQVVEATVTKACERCQAGGRKTVKPFDF